MIQVHCEIESIVKRSVYFYISPLIDKVIVFGRSKENCLILIDAVYGDGIDSWGGQSEWGREAGCVQRMVGGWEHLSSIHMCMVISRGNNWTEI